MKIDGTSALKFDYMDNVPWSKSPAFSADEHTQEYLNAFEAVIDKIPTRDLKISFTDDVWDFNPYFKDTQTANHKFIFLDLPNELKEYSKFYVLYKISGKTKVATVHNRYTQFASVLLHIIANTPHKNIHVITTADIVNEIKNRNVSPGTAHSLYYGIYELYNFLIKHYKLKLPVDMDVIASENEKANKLVDIMDSKLPDIPDEYFNVILNKALSVMRDSTAEHNMRMAAAGVVFISQTGLRLGDFLALTTDRLHKKTLAKSGNEVHYVHFTARKPSRAHQPLLEFDIFSNSLATEAFHIMKSLRQESVLSSGNNILFVLQPYPRVTSSNYIPHSKAQFGNVYRRFMLKYLPTESTTPWEGIAPAEHHTNHRGEKKGTCKPTIVYIPETRQYRVHLCTTLYNRGVPLVYIQKYMGHLSEAMLGYYVRPKDTYQENIQYSEKVIREIAEDNTTPLGGNMLGQELKENIQKFIADNGFNVHTDIEAIVKALGDKIIIRGKTGGVCIKTSLMPCSKDARTNEMMCAYNVCPNLFHFYYMVDISYMNFQTLQETYKAMLSTGKVKAAQKELAKLKDVLNRRLIPELDELDKEIVNKGYNTILDKYPALIDIMENRESIRKEIEEWRTKK